MPGRDARRLQRSLKVRHGLGVLKEGARLGPLEGLAGAWEGLHRLGDLRGIGWVGNLRVQRGRYFVCSRLLVAPKRCISTGDAIMLRAAEYYAQCASGTSAGTSTGTCGIVVVGIPVGTVRPGRNIQA